MDLLHIDRVEKLKEPHYKWAEAALNQNDHPHVGKWTESVGVGSKDFFKTVKEKLGTEREAKILFHLVADMMPSFAAKPLLRRFNKIKPKRRHRVRVKNMEAVIPPIMTTPWRV